MDLENQFARPSADGGLVEDPYVVVHLPGSREQGVHRVRPILQDQQSRTLGQDGSTRLRAGASVIVRARRLVPARFLVRRIGGTHELEAKPPNPLRIDRYEHASHESNRYPL